MKSTREHTSGSVPKSRPDKMSLRYVLPLILFFVIVGVLLIWLNEQVVVIATYVLAATLAVYGIWLIFSYFRSTVAQRLAGRDLAVGLLLAMTGFLLALQPNSLDQLLPKIWGLALIFGGFLKIQFGVDERSVRVRRWWIMLIFAAVSLVIGILSLMGTRVFTKDNENLFVGIFMLFEAVLDLVTYFVINNGAKRHSVIVKEAPAPAPAAQASEAAPAPAPAPENTPAP